MHQDQTPDHDQPVIHVTQWPQYVDQSDGTVRAYYPGDDWHVVGFDRADARQKLRDEFDRRIQDPAYVADHLSRAKNHLYGGEVTPGFQVDTLSRDDYQRRTEELGERLRKPSAER
jgi:hypothetical protein